MTSLSPDRIQKLKKATRFFYDLQALRMQSGARASQVPHLQDAEKVPGKLGLSTATIEFLEERKIELPEKKKIPLDWIEETISKVKDAPSPIVLELKDAMFLAKVSTGLEQLEKDALKECLRLLKGIPIWDEWLQPEVKGVGPTMGAVILTSFDVHRADTVSKFWAIAGLAVDNETGKAVKLQRGKKAKFDPWLKAKMIEVLGKSFLKAKSEPYYEIYVDIKHRRQNQFMPVCMACEGTHVFMKEPCRNCDAGKKSPPWGRSDAHRELDARRRMVKQFLVDLHTRWRTLEGLPVRPPYHEQYLGLKHHG